jgi:mobilome CxxCx(11)CxxC protein
MADDRPTQDQTRIDAVFQQKMNALAAKHLHERRLAKLRRWSLLVDYLAVGVPVLYFPARYIAKGTAVSNLIEHAWEVLAAILLCSAILKITYRWQERAEQHSKLISENISLSWQADYFLDNNKHTSPENISWFLRLAENCEKEDRAAFGIVKEEEKRLAYREALKEFNPSSIDTICPKCGVSPWEYKPGSCQLCGNTPKLQVATISQRPKGD